MSESGEYIQYTNQEDNSKIYIKPNGAVVRIPVRKIGPDGRIINRGARLITRDNRKKELTNDRELIYKCRNNEALKDE